MSLPVRIRRAAHPWVALLLAVSCAPFATDTKSAVDQLLAAADPTTTAAIQIESLADGAVVYSQDADRLLLPASNLKLLTAAAAVSFGALDEAPRTTLRGSADARGPLWLVGDADPLLSIDDLGDMVEALRRRGVVRIDGPLIATGARYPGPSFGAGWAWDDEPASYMPYVSGLTLERGRVTVIVRDEDGAPRVEVQPDPGHIAVVARVTTAAGEDDGGVTITRVRAGDVDRIEVSGALAAGATRERRLSIPDPERYAATVLKHLLVEAGLTTEALSVEVSTSFPGDDAVELAAIDRPTAEILRAVLKDSDNLAAELLLRRLAPPGSPDATAAGVARVEEYIARLGHDPAAYRIADGSGLSRMNLVSARLLMAVLRDLARSERAQEVFSSMAVAGVDGTLAGRMRDTSAAGVARAKTGSLGGVSALSGYTRDESGAMIAFAILVQNFTGSAQTWRDRQDAVVVELTGSHRPEPLVDAAPGSG